MMFCVRLFLLGRTASTAESVFQENSLRAEYVDGLLPLTPMFASRKLFK